MNGEAFLTYRGANGAGNNADDFRRFEESLNLKPAPGVSTAPSEEAFVPTRPVTDNEWGQLRQEDYGLTDLGQRAYSVAMYATCDRLVVLRVVSPEEAEIVYDGPGQPVWEKAGKMGKNGQRVVTLSRLRAIAATAHP